MAYQHIRPTMALIVVAGGASQRMGGTDKALLQVDGRSYLQHVISEAAPHCVETVIVGPRRDLDPGNAVNWTVEDPPGSGPLAGLAAGFAALRSQATHCAVLSCDAPFAGRTLPRLLAHLISLREKGKPCDAVLAQDGAGYPQPLIAVYDRPAADYALKRLHADNRIENSPLRLLRQSLRTAALEISDLESLDVDTTADRDTLERLLHSQNMETQRTQKAGQ